MLRARDLPTFLWAEAVHAAVFLQNRTLSRAHPGATPYETCHGAKPRVEHLRIFGSAAYTHIPKHFRKKFDSKSKKLILVGYQEDSTNYRLLDQKARKISVSKDVVFDEDDLGRDAQLPNTSEFEVMLPCEENTVNPNEIERGEAVDDTWTDANEAWANAGERVLEENMNATSEGENRRPVPYQLRDRSSIPKRILYQANVAELLPLIFHEAVNGPESAQWKRAIDEEIESHRENATWELVPRTEEMKPVNSK